MSIDPMVPLVECILLPQNSWSKQGHISLQCDQHVLDHLWHLYEMQWLLKQLYLSAYTVYTLSPANVFCRSS